ncbi:isoprenylcysteine carboxylmethyltransferase family protein [bacterium]|nr:isoprenylcysteine carboxylmethyltransferase family protein [bacterium]
MKRWLVLLFGLSSYLMFLGVFLYSIVFIGNFWISHSLDGLPRMGFWPALAIDLGLLAAFAVQHSGMARSGFKEWLTRYVPEAAERSTYVLLSNVAVVLMFVLWQPLGGMVWSVENSFLAGAIYGLYSLGWLLLFISTCAICHFDLFGLRQVWLYFQERPYVPYEFRIPMLYSVVRHPLYVAWLVIFWAAPVMSLSHLVFAVGTTAYILIAIQLEERDLVGAFGQKYVNYQKSVPMIVPTWPSDKLRNAADSSVLQGSRSGA